MSPRIAILLGRFALVQLSCLALFACPGPQVDCRVGADCASGVCLRDGTCGPVTEADSGMGGGSGGGNTGGGAGGGTGGGTTGGGGGGSTGGGSGGGNVGGGTGGGSIGCLPNNDGVIERGEVFFQAGLRATFKISGPATFDTAGTAAPDGGRNWDFTPQLAGDASRLVETKSLQGEWYESKYPDAGYVSELGQGSTLLGVFSASNDGLYLQGVVSPMNDTQGTEVHYAPWVKVLQFPLLVGSAWGVTTTVSGKYQGFVIGNAAFGTGLPFQEENYTSVVDRAGDALTPYSNFHSVRVRTVMVRSTRVYTLNPWTPILTLRSYNWNTECFGTVATLTSTDNESNTEFTDVAEVRRLSP